MKDKKIISVSINTKDLLYLKKRGINRSELLRQAVKALKEKKIKYNYEK